MQPARLDLLIVADSFGGGLGASAQAHARWFANEGWSVALAAPSARADEIAGAEAVDLPIPDAARDGAAMLSAAQGLRKVMRHRQPRVVHAHGTRAQLLTLLAGRRPYVTLHGTGRAAGKRSVGSAGRWAVTYAAAWLAVRAYSVTPTPGRWRTTLHASPRLATLGQFGEPPTMPVPVFLWIGRLDWPKTPETFVLACARVAQSRQIKGLMLGDGPRLAEMRALVRSSEAPVDVLGDRPDVQRYLDGAAAVCLFSTSEGVPFSVQEAMWSGRGVVLSPLPGLTWFAGDAAVYAGDVAQAAAAMLQLCNSVAATELGARASARAHELLSPDAPFPELSSDYRS